MAMSTSILTINLEDPEDQILATLERSATLASYWCEDMAYRVNW